MAISETGFISNVNEIVGKLDAIELSNTYFDAETLAILEGLDVTTLTEVSEDLVKGTHLGYRKLDIKLELNNLNGIPASEAEYIYYSSADFTLRDGTTFNIEFTNTDGNPSFINESVDLKAQFTKNADYLALVTYTNITLMSGLDTNDNDEIDQPSYLRITDVIGEASNVDTIRLVVSSTSPGSAESAVPTYYWAKTSSALEVLGGRVADLIAIGENMAEILVTSDLKTELEALGPIASEITTVATNIAAITTNNANAANINTVAANDTNVTIVADAIASVISTALNIANVVSVAANEININAVEANEANINLLSSNMADISTVVTNIAEILAVNTNQANINSAVANESNINAVVANKPSIDVVAGLNTDVSTLAAISTDITDLVGMKVSTLDPVIANEVNITAVADNMAEILLADTNAATATTQAGIATTKATEASDSAAEALDHLNDITGLTVNTATLVEGSTATSSFNPTSNILSLGIPVGDTGNTGPAFAPDSTGTIASRSTYDSEVIGYAYLSTDEVEPYLYFRSTATAGTWTTGVPFGKGETGDDGLGWLSGTGVPDNGNGLDGEFYLNDANGDVYSKAAGTWSFLLNLTPVLDDSTTDIAKVWSSDKINTELNLKSDSTHNHDATYEPINSNIQDHIADSNNPHNVSASDIGLGNVNDTSDLNKPVSTATADAIANIQATAQNNAVGLSIVFGS